MPTVPRMSAIVAAIPSRITVNDAEAMDSATKSVSVRVAISARE